MEPVVITSTKEIDEAKVSVNVAAAEFLCLMLSSHRLFRNIVAFSIYFPRNIKAISNLY